MEWSKEKKGRRKRKKERTMANKQLARRTVGKVYMSESLTRGRKWGKRDVHRESDGEGDKERRRVNTC